MHLKSDLLHGYWNRLHNELVAQDPHVPPIKTSRHIVDPDIEQKTLNNNTQRLELVEMAEGDRDKMQSHHAAFVHALGTLSRDLPMWKGTRGVVIPAGGGYLGIALTSVLMLYRSGSKLPVHVFVDTYAERDPYICDSAFPRLGAECLVFEDLLGSSIADMKHFQFKALALLCSPFEQVLFLDSDAWPIRAPDHLFDTVPFTSHGLITWPDFWQSTTSPTYYQIAGFTPPKMTTRLSSEAGILLYNKATHAKCLLLATYYNWYGPNYYYTLFSQGAIGEGDKETFAHAAMATGQSFWDVRAPVSVFGRWINGSYETSGMKQADPEEDYHFHSDAPNVDHALQSPEDNSTRTAKTLFIHHNLFKVNMATIGKEDDNVFRLDSNGQQTRLWGLEEKLNHDSGDVERAMWDVVLAANCRVSFLSECSRLQRWYDAVFTNNLPLAND
ncbi:alpha-1,2-mannosyltransferase [Colletotrichum tofieldiae]|uniref:Alpha-1,2-mannosyltransferase n=1 Tax=Colletotrichum tofieldiae TaxID=708197 RepID=A0A166YTK0_9PEZI|nr:alpha-1,2-mannosyltransferase [Colletotrichum tofieldiae]